MDDNYWIDLANQWQSLQILAKAAESRNTPSWILNQLPCGLYYTIDYNLVTNPKAGVIILGEVYRNLDNFEKDEQILLIQILAKHPNAGPEILSEILNKYGDDIEIIYSLIKNPSISSKDLVKIYEKYRNFDEENLDENDFDFLYKIGINPKVPNHLLETIINICQKNNVNPLYLVELMKNLEWKKNSKSE